MAADRAGRGIRRADGRGAADHRRFRAVRPESFPIACSASLADRNARRARFEEWIGREEASFALPPSRLALDPTDVVRIVHDGRAPDYALTRISDGDGRRIEARRVDPSIYDLPPGPERKPAVTVPTVLGRPVALLMNLPQLADDIPAGRPYAAVFAKPWYGEAAIWRSATEDGFEFLDALGRPARIGALAFDLYGGPAGRFDLGNEVWIDLPSARRLSARTRSSSAWSARPMHIPHCLPRRRITFLVRFQYWNHRRVPTGSSRSWQGGFHLTAPR